MSIENESFYDPETATLTYIVFDNKTKDAIVIDPVLNYDLKTQEVSYNSVNQIVKFVKKNNLNLILSIDTHVHADHMTGTQSLKESFPKLKSAINKNITCVQEHFSNFFSYNDFICDGSQFDILLEDRKELHAGSIKILPFFTPGHTPACTSLLIENSLYAGDTIFMPDFGTGRCDFPHGSAKDLYNSIHEIFYKLPDDTKVFIGHDYMPNDRELRYESTIGEQKKQNKHIKATTTEDEFVKSREKRDATLPEPKLLIPSLQVNISAGKAEEKKVC